MLHFFSKKSQRIFALLSFVALILFLLFYVVVHRGIYKEALTIVAFGDSLTEGYAVRPEDTYPAQLERMLRQNGFPAVTIYNQGYSGNTTYDGLKRIGDVIALKPQIVILAFGSNDIMRHIPVAVAKNNVLLMIDTLESKHAVVILAGVKMPADIAGAYGNDFEKMYEDIARERNLLYIPNLLEHVAFRPEFIQKDALHPNKDGYTIIAQRNVLPEVMKALVRIR